MNSQRGTILVYGLIALAILGVLSGIAWKIYSAGQTAKQVEWGKAAAQQTRKETAQSTHAATQLEAKNAESKVVYKTITRTVDKYIDRPVYRTECFDADGLRDANAALNGQAAAPPKPDYSMPRPDPAGRRPGWLGAAQID
jgi:Tfp pilus assembly major pilin PilA